MAACVFCGIVAGSVPAHKVLEDETCVAFLDARPVFPGHALLVPRVHYPTLLDLPASLIAPFFLNAQRLARAMEEGLGADGSFVATNTKVSQSVAHLHVHVVPRRKKDGLRGFFWPRQTYADDAEVQRILAALRGALEAQPAK